MHCNDKHLIEIVTVPTELGKTWRSAISQYRILSKDGSLVSLNTVLHLERKIVILQINTQSQEIAVFLSPQNNTLKRYLVGILHIFYFI